MPGLACCGQAPGGRTANAPTKGRQLFAVHASGPCGPGGLLAPEAPLSRPAGHARSPWRGSAGCMGAAAVSRFSARGCSAISSGGCLANRGWRTTWRIGGRPCSLAARGHRQPSILSISHWPGRSVQCHGFSGQRPKHQAVTAPEPGALAAHRHRYWAGEIQGDGVSMVAPSPSRVTLSVASRATMRSGSHIARRADVPLAPRLCGHRCGRRARAHALGPPWSRPRHVQPRRRWALAKAWTTSCSANGSRT